MAYSISRFETPQTVPDEERFHYLVNPTPRTARARQKRQAPQAAPTPPPSSGWVMPLLVALFLLGVSLIAFVLYASLHNPATFTGP
ncbi:MAG: hypothetical protein R2834_05150 [Rhodothermales bacterium]